MKPDRFNGGRSPMAEYFTNAIADNAENSDAESEDLTFELKDLSEEEDFVTA